MLFVLDAGSALVEAAFATGTLLMSEGQYGLLISISGAGYVTGAVLNSIVVEKFNVKELIIGGGLIFSGGYLIFSTFRTYFVASIGFFLISFALSSINTGFRTYTQTRLPVEKMGQITASFNGLLAILEMVTVALVSGVSSFIHMRIVLVVTQIIMLSVVFVIRHLSKQINFDSQ